MRLGRLHTAGHLHAWQRRLGGASNRCASIYCSWHQRVLATGQRLPRPSLMRLLPHAPPLNCRSFNFRRLDGTMSIKARQQVRPGESIGLRLELWCARRRSADLCALQTASPFHILLPCDGVAELALRLFSPGLYRRLRTSPASRMWA